MDIFLQKVFILIYVISFFLLFASMPVIVQSY
jgi:hypothetical protein